MLTLPRSPSPRLAHKSKLDAQETITTVPDVATTTVAAAATTTVEAAAITTVTLNLTVRLTLTQSLSHATQVARIATLRLSATTLLAGQWLRFYQSTI